MTIRFPHFSPLQLILFLLLCSCSGQSLQSKPDFDALPAGDLESLNATIGKASHYLQHKESLLDSIKLIAYEAKSQTEKWRAYVAVSEGYRQMDVDSALHYASLAQGISHQLPDSVARFRADFAFIDALSTAGIFPLALQQLDSLAPAIKADEDKINFWKVSRRCYSYIMTWAGNNEYYVRMYEQKYTACDDSLLRQLPVDDDFRQFIFCERLVKEHRWREARGRLEALLNSLPQESNIYGMAAYQLALVHRNSGDISGYAKHLALAAESDIKGGVREGLALPTLANWAYAHGDIDNAFRYVNHTLEDANSGNIRMQTTSIAPIIPLIDTAIRRRSATSRNQMMAYIIISTCLFAVTIVLFVFTFISLKKRRLSQEKLAASSRKLETYIGNFIGLCSNYAERIDQMAKLVTRKISSGQSDELMKLINTGKFAEEDNEEFFRLIDKALLDIFPDFVEQINYLLRPDCQIKLDPGQALSPELRIYAFVRLGVDQSSNIARILGYSVNTVYAYRNRMRNRAIDRSHFDSQVASID